MSFLPSQLKLISLTSKHDMKWKPVKYFVIVTYTDEVIAVLISYTNTLRVLSRV